jgi:hypothetical protein
MSSRDVSTDSRLAKRLEEIDEFMGWQSLAVYALCAMPSNVGIDIDGFYARDGLKGALDGLGDRPLRWAGFGLGYGLDVRAEGEALITEDKDRILWIEPDGFLVCATAGTAEFLGWAQERYPTQLVEGRPGLRINEVVLVEYTFEFCRFVAEELLPRLEDRDWMQAVSIQRARSGEFPLYLGAQNVLSRQVDQAIVDSWSREFEMTGDPERDAFVLLEAVYQRFQRGPERIPFGADRLIPRSAIVSIGEQGPVES